MYDRQLIIEMIYDTNEFPESMRSLYGDVYYALQSVSNTENNKCTHILKYSPSDYRCDDEYVVKTLPIFLEQVELTILYKIYEVLENNIILANHNISSQLPE